MPTLLPVDQETPRTLVLNPPLTDAEFEAMCAAEEWFQLKGLTKDKLTGFPRLCPDFVIELLSKSDSVPKGKQKMERWVENGAALGWLIDPYKKRVYVYEAGGEVSTVKGKTRPGERSGRRFHPRPGRALALL